VNDLPRLAWRNIWRNKRRTWLTSAAIAFAAISIIFILPIQEGAYTQMIDISLRVFPGHAQVQAPGYQQQPQMYKTVDDAANLADSLRQTGHYKAVSVRAQGFALMSSANRSYGASVVGVQPQTESTVSLIPGMITEGRYLSSNDALEAVIGSALARNLRVKPGDELTLLGSAKDGSVAATIVTVAGIFRSGSNEFDRFFVEIPLGTFQGTFSMGKSAHNITILGDNPKQQSQLLKQLRQDIGREDLALLGWDQLMPGLKEGIQLDRVSGYIFYIILLAIIIFSIFNTFLMSILERTREFGLMLALGTRPYRITSIVMLESFFLTLIGLSIGTVAGIALTYYLDTIGGIPYPAEVAEQFNIPLNRMPPEITLVTIFSGPLIILVSTNLIAWIPLLRIRKLEPVEAMRTV
jgi:putative ABC transport system permease protein